MNELKCFTKEIDIDKYFYYVKVVFSNIHFDKVHLSTVLQWFSN